MRSLEEAHGVRLAPPRHRGYARRHHWARVRACRMSPLTGVKREAQARATRRSILAAALELFVASGYSATSIQVIADRAASPCRRCTPCSEPSANCCGNSSKLHHQ